MKNDQFFPSKVCHFQYDHRFIFSRKWGTLERAKMYVCKSLLDLDCQGSIRLGIFYVAYK